jgi:hypothetical protein
MRISAGTKPQDYADVLTQQPGAATSQLRSQNPSDVPVTGSDASLPTPDEQTLKLVAVPMVQSVEVLTNALPLMVLSPAEFAFEATKKWGEDSLLDNVTDSLWSTACLNDKNLLACSSAIPTPQPGPAPAPSPSQTPLPTQP